MVSVMVFPEDIKGKIIEVKDKNDINHLKNSFRLKSGDMLRVVDGEKEYITKILSIEKKLLLAEIEKVFEDRFSSSVKIDAAIGMIKNDKMEMMIQKLTEIGINKIIPLKLNRTIIKLSGKKEKWDIVSREALKQCQGVKLVEISNPLTLKQIDYSNYDLIIVPYEKNDELKIKDILTAKNEIKSVLYLIGSEGGFEEEEINYLFEHGAKAVTLGKRILRAETAAIVTGGILINEFGE